MGRGTVRSSALKSALWKSVPKIFGMLALVAALSLQSAAAQTKTPKPDKTQTYYLLVFSNPVAGQEAEYNRWYSNRHQQDVVSIPGFKTAQRFVISDVQLRESKPLPKYAIIYKIETEDLGSVYAEVRRRIEAGITVMSPAYDRATSIEFTYRVSRPLVFPRGSSTGGHKTNASGAEESGAEYFQIVFSDPTTPALEDEYNRWYDKTHELDVVSAPGFVEAQRFALSDIQLGNNPPLTKYLAMYKIVSNDIAARFADYRRLAPSMSTSPAMGMSYGYTYKAMEPMIYGDQIRAERAMPATAIPGAQSASSGSGQQSATATPPGGVWNSKAPWGPLQTAGPRSGPPISQIREPFKIFDNVYYVGLQSVSSYLVSTSGGLVLLDATFSDTADSVLSAIRKLGFSPSNLKYIFLTHSHLDHFGGAGKIQELTGARVAMSMEDWQSVEAQQQKAASGDGQGGGPGGGQNLGLRLVRDLVVHDNDVITVGDTTFKFYFSPGHTVGATSIEFQVRDRGKQYRAIVPGGMGMQFGPEWTPVFIKSIQRLKQLGPWEVMLGNHPFLMPRDLELEIEPELAKRGEGPNPAVVGPAAINQWFDEVLKVANDKLVSEQTTQKEAR